MEKYEKLEKYDVIRGEGGYNISNLPTQGEPAIEPAMLIGPDVCDSMKDLYLRNDK